MGQQTFDIPYKQYTLVAYDGFMSDWGICEGKWSVAVLTTDDYTVAANIYKKLCERPEMTKVMFYDITTPMIDLVNCVVDYLSPELCGSWYEAADPSLGRLRTETIRRRFWASSDFLNPDKDKLGQHKRVSVPVSATNRTGLDAVGVSKVDSEVLAILDRCRVEGNVLFLPSGQLPSKLYQAVDRVLTAMGGKWNRKVGGHVFDSCPDDVLDSVLLTGEVTNEKTKYQFFPTPKPLAKRLVELAGIEPGDVVLEPSAGDGAIVKAVREIHGGDVMLLAVEKNPKHEQALLAAGADGISIGDFLDVEMSGVKKIVANPPFTRQQDIDHVNHMLDCLGDGGRLVSVMSLGTLSNTNKKAVEFRDRISEMGGTFIEVPAGTFAESGTQVATCILTVNKN